MHCHEYPNTATQLCTMRLELHKKGKNGLLRNHTNRRLSSPPYWNTDCPQSEASGDRVAVWRAVWLMEISHGDMWWSHGLFECSMEWQKQCSSGACGARVHYTRTKGFPKSACGKTYKILLKVTEVSNNITCPITHLYFSLQWHPPLTNLKCQWLHAALITWWCCWRLAWSNAGCYGHVQSCQS